MQSGRIASLWRRLMGCVMGGSEEYFLARMCLKIILKENQRLSPLWFSFYMLQIPIPNLKYAMV